MVPDLGRRRPTYHARTPNHSSDKVVLNEVSFEVDLWSVVMALLGWVGENGLLFWFLRLSEKWWSCTNQTGHVVPLSFSLGGNVRAMRGEMRRDLRCTGCKQTVCRRYCVILSIAGMCLQLGM